MDADTQTSSETPAYIARCKCGCGGIVFAVVDNPERAADTAKKVADCIRDGYAVERATVGTVRSQPFGCQLPKASLKDFWISDKQKKVQKKEVSLDI